MKHLMLSSMAIAALLMSGCAKKTPEVDMTDYNAPSEAERLAALQNQIQSQMQNVYFDFNKYNIKPDQQSAISNDAALLNQAGAESLKVQVQGNCDEWGSGEYNYALGLKRAKAGKDALIADGVSADRISIVSYGKSNPVCTEKTRECDARNRRDEFKVSQ